MKHPLETCDFEAVTRLWNEYYPARYRVDAGLLRANTIDVPVFDWGASAVVRDGDRVVGFAFVKRSATPLMWKGIDPDQAHLTAVGFTDPQIGVDILAGVKRLLRQRGASQIVFGQDARHFFPGCPTDFPTLENFLTIEGFQPGGEAHDLERDLSDYSNRAPLVRPGEIRPLTHADVSNLDMFFDREFPFRWKSDTMAKIASDGPDCTVGLFIDGRIEGFALIQNWSHATPIGGAVWKADLGENWSALGPIGVSQALRGQGYGDAVLGAALDHLQRLGARRCIIDWTGLQEFYGRHGFETQRTYRSYTLSLDAA